MKKFALLIWVIGTLAQPTYSADLMTSQLVDQARLWQQKDRDDLAAEIWRKLLRSDPNHGEALVKLGLIEARAGNREEAGLLLTRAIQLNPRPRGLDRLATALRDGKTERHNVEQPSTKSNTPTVAQRAGVKKKKKSTAQTPNPGVEPDSLTLKLSTSLDHPP